MYYNTYMNLNFIIREYREEDKPQIEQISWQIQEWEKKYYPGRALSKDIITRHIERLIQLTKNEEGIILVATEGESCIGYVVGTIHKDFLNTEDAFYVNDMGVEEKYRGKGVGTALLKEIEKTAKEKFKLNKMMIAVICGNDGAENLYKRMGFVPYELELIKSI